MINIDTKNMQNKGEQMLPFQLICSCRFYTVATNRFGILQRQISAAVVDFLNVTNNRRQV